MNREDTTPSDFPRPHGVKMAEEARMTTELVMGPVELRDDNGAERFRIGTFWLTCHRKGLEPVMIRDERGAVPTITVRVLVSGRNVWA